MKELVFKICICAGLSPVLPISKLKVQYLFHFELSFLRWNKPPPSPPLPPPFWVGNFAMKQHESSPIFKQIREFLLRVATKKHVNEAIFNELEHGWTRLSCHVCLSQNGWSIVKCIPHLPHVNNTNKGFGVGVGEAFAFGCHHENLKNTIEMKF
jgi:hypothetical protein